MFVLRIRIRIKNEELSFHAQMNDPVILFGFKAEIFAEPEKAQNLLVLQHFFELMHAQVFRKLFMKDLHFFYACIADLLFERCQYGLNFWCFRHYLASYQF